MRNIDFTTRPDGTLLYRDPWKETYPIRQNEAGTWTAYIGTHANARPIPATAGSETPEAVVAILEGIRTKRAEADRAKEAEKKAAKDAAYLAAKEAEAEAQEREYLAATLPASETPATARQVAFIMRLIARGAHHEGGFYIGPTTREGVEQMTKGAASAYITSLLGEY